MTQDGHPGPRFEPLLSSVSRLELARTAVGEDRNVVRAAIVEERVEPSVEQLIVDALVAPDPLLAGLSGQERERLLGSFFVHEEVAVATS